MVVGSRRKLIREERSQNILSRLPNPPATIRIKQETQAERKATYPRTKTEQEMGQSIQIWCIALQDHRE